MMVVDKLPLSLTERNGFKEFVKVLQPLYHLPCEKTLTGMMERKYSVLQAQIKTVLTLKKNLVLTTDLWTESMTTKVILDLLYIILMVRVFYISLSLIPSVL